MAAFRRTAESMTDFAFRFGLYGVCTLLGAALGYALSADVQGVGLWAILGFFVGESLRSLYTTVAA